RGFPTRRRLEPAVRPVPGFVLERLGKRFPFLRPSTRLARLNGASKEEKLYSPPPPQLTLLADMLNSLAKGRRITDISHFPTSPEGVRLLGEANQMRLLVLPSALRRHPARLRLHPHPLPQQTSDHRSDQTLSAQVSRQSQDVPPVLDGDQIGRLDAHAR
ncbi:unnamed protein product, partial [Protopolystoma xenopodis]